MPSCEKCWGDSYLRALTSFKDQSECYHDLIQERNSKPCTPEEQAGSDASICPECHRKTIHQYAKVCMSCGCSELKINRL